MNSELQRLKILNDCFQEKIKTLEAKVKRLQQSKLDKAAMMAMQGLLFYSVYPEEEYEKCASVAIKQAKSLLAALEKEGGDEMP